MINRREFLGVEDEGRAHNRRIKERAHAIPPEHPSFYAIESDVMKILPWIIKAREIRKSKTVQVSGAILTESAEKRADVCAIERFLVRNIYTSNPRVESVLGNLSFYGGYDFLFAFGQFGQVRRHFTVRSLGFGIFENFIYLFFGLFLPKIFFFIVENCF